MKKKKKTISNESVMKATKSGMLQNSVKKIHQKVEPLNVCLDKHYSWLRCCTQIFFARGNLMYFVLWEHCFGLLLRYIGYHHA